MNPTSPQRTSDGRYCKGSGRAPVHGHASGGKLTPEYECWTNMKTRCNNPNYKHWKDYGGRGIKVCERWDTFENFIADMGLRPTPKHTIERKNNELGYTPENCCWIPKPEQAKNKRSNHIIEFQGERKNVREWSRHLGVPYQLIINRLHLGWDGARALTEPKHFRG